MDNRKFFNDNEFDLFRVKYTSEPSEELVDFLKDTTDSKGVVFGFQFITMLKSFTASGYEFINFLDKYSEISRKFNEPFVKELKSILTGDLDDFAKIKRITEAKDRKDLKRVREGIVSNKNGEKTFEEVYGDSIETDEEDDINANMYAHCFESIANKSSNRIRESNDSISKKRIRETSENFYEDVLSRPDDFRYMMLDRFIRDCEYYLQNPNQKHLWSGDAISHADNMLELYNSFPEDKKPEWLSRDKLTEYRKELYVSVGKELPIEKDVNKEEVSESEVYDYFMGLSSGRGMSLKSAAQATVKHFQEIDEDFCHYDVANALSDDYEFDDLFN